MELINSNFEFPNLENVASVEPPLVSARYLLDHDDRPIATIVRVILYTNSDLASEPVLDLSQDGTGSVEYITNEASSAENPYLVWYAEATLPVVEEISLNAVDKRLPPQTSRGTRTTVQTGTSNTIDA